MRRQLSGRVERTAVQTIRISQEDVDALARVTMSEVGHFGRYGATTLKGGVEAVVDTILNRVAHPSHPNSVEDVVDKRFQFSAINKVKTWRGLQKASDKVARIVRTHLGDRLDGKACTVRGAQNFLNPHHSSRDALIEWGHHVWRRPVAVWGEGRDIHFHGFAPNSGPPPAYRLEMNGKAHEFTGHGKSASAGEGTALQEPDVAVAGVTFVEPEQDPALAYRVEEIPAANAASLQATLNGCSAEGWRLRQILPAADKLLIVLEGDFASEFVHEGDDRSSDDESLAAPPAVLDGSPEAHFARFLGDLKLTNFKPHEFLFLGGQNAQGPARGLNTMPPEDVWENIKPTALVLDKLRATLGAPIHLTSIYRSPAYNKLLSGAAKDSVHMRFQAADFWCEDGRGPVWWAKRLKDLRDDGLFEGGIGVYKGFVHVDTRGRNAKFGPWLHKVFG